MSDDNNEGTGSETPNEEKVTPNEKPKHEEGNHKEEGKSQPESKKHEGFSEDYVKKIREEAKSHRTKANDLEKKLEEAKVQIETLGKSAFDKANKISVAIEKRLINAEIQKIAKEEGIIDTDAFKMADLSNVKLSEDGEVTGLTAIVADMRAKKPYLFAVASSAQKGAKPPVDNSSNAEKPTYETFADFNKATSKFLSSL